jgi:hypothetical protein
MAQPGQGIKAPVPESFRTSNDTAGIEWDTPNQFNTIVSGQEEDQNSNNEDSPLYFPLSDDWKPRNEYVKATDLATKCE